MIVGSARSIALILTDGGVMDTIVHVLAGGLDLVPTVPVSYTHLDVYKRQAFGTCTSVSAPSLKS